MAYQPGQDLGRSDLNLLLTDSQGRATNAAEIFYTLLFLDPGPPAVEVQIGSERRVPVNPSVGEYYAALMIPHAATAGTYRIRWTFRQTIDAPLNQIVQEFEVQAVTPLVVSPYTASEREMIQSLRVMLRDNCVGGEETVEVNADGEILEVSLEDLWSILQGECRC